MDFTHQLLVYVDYDNILGVGLLTIKKNTKFTNYQKGG